MSKIYQDTKCSTAEISSSLGLNLTGNSTRIKHIGSGTLNVQSTLGEISVQTSNTSDGIKIGTTGSPPVNIGNANAAVIINSSGSTIDSDLVVSGNLQLDGNVLDANGNEIVKLSAASNAINELTLSNSATSTNPTVSATGSDTNIGISLQSKGTGGYNFLGTATSSTKLILYEDTSNGTNTLTVQAPSSIATSYTLTLPDNDGSNDQFLKTNGSGTLTWSGPNKYSRTVVGTSTYTVLSTDDIVAVTYTTTGACTITLPAISSIGSVKISIVDEGGNSGTNNIIVAYATGDYLLGLDGNSNTYLINSDYGSITLYNNSSNGWFIYSG